MPARALINGAAYSWSSIRFNILGLSIIGISAINYKEKQEIEDIPGAGNRAVARGYGNITTESSITLHMNELQNLRDAVDTGSILDIPEFDIVVAFLPPAGKIVTHTLKNVRFAEDGVDAQQNAKNLETQIELRIGEVIFK